MGALVAGVDSSTQSTKVLIVDSETGEQVALGRAPHVVTGTGGARESDPAMWWSALASALSETGRAEEIAAISVAAQQHGLVVLDADGEPLRPAVLWNDTRAAEDVDRLLASLGGRERWVGATCSVPVAAFTVSSWAWLRRTAPEIAAAVRAVRVPHDYLTERLTGRAVTDRGDASGTGWWSPDAGEYQADVLSLEEVALDAGMLPTVLGPDEPAGAITDTASAATGLRSGIPVGPGTGDNMAAALGLGLDSGQVAMSLGTSGTVFAVSGAPSADPTGVIAGFADAAGGYLPLACTLNCTLAVDRVAQLLGIEREAVADDTELVFLPFLDGERTPDLPGAAGTMIGLRHTTSAGEILLAAYRGAVASLLEAVDRMAAQSGVAAASPLVLVGGGAQGLAWQRTVSELSGRPVVVPEPDEFVARGAAAQAAAVLGGEQPDDVGRRWVRSGQRREIPQRPADLGALARIRGAIATLPDLYPAD